ncbi:MAG: lipid-A-disaccharide synthase N-terminal domain-containing protein [Alphaproteobacteria bacterium]
MDMTFMDITAIWLGIGFLGQALFSMRFLVQWIYSEKHGKSLIPVAFWYFSLAGGATLLSYAIHREDPVFIVGQAGGLAIYFRNLYLIHRERHRAGESAST